MAIQFVQKFSKQQKRQTIIALILLVTVIFGISFLRGRTGERDLAPELEDTRQLREERVEIDFHKLEDKILRALTPLEGVTPPEAEIGRENPFAPVPFATPTEDILDYSDEETFLDRLLGKE